MIKLALAATAALVLFASPATADDPVPACAASALRVGDCFTVRGRVTSCTAVPSIRIWIIGTKRILGVADAEGDVAGERLLPEPLETEMSQPPPCSKAAFGTFTVCPLTPSRPGVMQRVCVASVEKVTVREW